MQSATLEICAVIVLSPGGLLKQLRKLELWDRLMMKRDFISGHETWQMSRCVNNANISLLEMLEWNIDRIVRVPKVTTFGAGGPCLNIFGHVVGTATVELVSLLSFTHDSLHFLTGWIIRELNPASSQLIFR